MPTRHADARWEGTLADGKGVMKLASGSYEGPYSFASRFEEGTGTNPEELIGAAHAGCFSMSLSKRLADAGFPPQAIDTTAHVHLERGEAGFSITRIELDTQGTVPGIEEAQFAELATAAKDACPVSRALAGVTISVKAALRASP